MTSREDMNIKFSIGLVHIAYNISKIIFVLIMYSLSDELIINCIIT